VLNDAVTYGGSSYRAKGYTTGNLPTNTTYWELIAQGFEGDLAGAFIKASDDTDDITEGATNKFATAGEKTKLSHITITQPVNLDEIESRVNELDASVILKGVWDASAGTFPGSGTAQAGWSYIVSVAGTVNGVAFSVNDRIIAITDNASTSTFASNWFKADYTDQVLSVAGRTGAVTLNADDVAETSTKKWFLDTEKTKLTNIEENADVTDATNVAAAGAFMKSSDDTDDITEGSTNKFATAAEKTKLSNITITQPVNLDDIETRVNELDAAVILKGTWDASAGTFPGSGTAQAGWSYIVSVAGTVNGVVFAVNDRIIAITDNASTSTFASNWFKADYTDQVASIDAQTGVLTLGALIAGYLTKDTIVDADTFGYSDSENSNASKKTTWGNIKSKLNTYLGTLYQAILVSGTNIKSINGTSILGPGDLTISSGGGYNYLVWEDDEHFMQTSLVGGFGFSFSNGGTGSGGASQASEADHPGIWAATCGTTATGFSNLNHVRSTAWFAIADGALDCEFLAKTPAALSDGTNTYTLRAGYGQATSGDGNNGAFFRYTHSVNSGNWQFVVRAAGADVLVINTSVAVVANTWVRLRFTMADVTQAIVAYIDGTNVGSGTPSSTIAAGQFVGRVFQCVKSVGTTSRSFFCDRHYTKQTLTF
jgi:hypothetical protein